MSPLWGRIFMGLTLRSQAYAGIALMVSVLSGCGAAVDAVLGDRIVTDTSAALEEYEPSESSAKDRFDRGAFSSPPTTTKPRRQTTRPQRSARVSGPGLTLRLGLGYSADSDSMSMAINLAMRTLIIQRLALEFGVDLSYPDVGQSQTPQVGGTLSAIVFMSGSRFLWPYIVAGAGASSGVGNAVDSLLISVLGGVGFEIRLNDALRVGLDCRGYVAIAADSPGNALQGVICAAALSFSPLALLH